MKEFRVHPDAISFKLPRTVSSVGWSGFGKGRMSATERFTHLVLSRMDKNHRASLFARLHDVGNLYHLLDTWLDAMGHRPYGSVENLVPFILPDLKPHPQTGWAWLQASINAVVHMDDMLKDFSEEIGWPMAARIDKIWAGLGSKTVRATSVVLLGMGFRKMLKASIRHLQADIHDAVIGQKAEIGAEWLTPGPDARAPNGVHLVFLNSQKKLYEESAALQHCVGGYGQNCKDRHCAILSLRDARGNNMSTAEIRRGTENRFVIHQHKSRGNAPPNQESRKAVEWWLEQANAPGSPWNIKVLKDSHRHTFGMIEDRLGRGWRTSEAHEFRWDRWRRILDTSAKTFPEFLMGYLNSGRPLPPGFDEVFSQAELMEEEMAITREIEKLEAGQDGILTP
jgi:hypothetical protein